MLKLRILTAVVLIPVFVTLILTLSPKAFCILTGMGVLWGSWEWSRLMGIQQTSKRLFYLLFMFAWLIGLLYLIYFELLSVIQLLYIALIWWLVAAVFVITYPKSRRLFSKGMVIRGAMGMLVLLPCWIALNFIYNIPNHGNAIVLFLFVLIWGADSFAYFVGKKWGTRPLLPLVSPGKTWQGCWGALVSSLIIGYIGWLWFHLPYSSLVSMLFLSCLTVVFSVLGDLFESMLKRNEGLKDSGKSLPGHGGILDRIDSLTAAAPIFALGAVWL